MKVCVVGLWHLGAVTAACLASAGHSVTGLDPDEDLVVRLKDGRPPLFEPGLEDLLKKSLDSGRLNFSTDLQQGVRSASVVWVTYDTPIDEDDHADVEFVVERVSRLFPYLESGQEILLSSQVPVGTTRRLEIALAHARPGLSVSISYSPENLRLGKAIAAFNQPDRVVIGVREQINRQIFIELLAPFTDRIEWMSVESAEMTKHALNAFLATSVAFINEVAVLCEQVGADAREVERGLKSEKRIGPLAYLSPGAAFAGGTLARDIEFLSTLDRELNLPGHLITAVRASNNVHKEWPRRRLSELLGGLRGKTIAVWGLTYKPGTDTLRRSSSLELCDWLIAEAVRVQAHDPAIKKLPGQYSEVQLCESALQAVQRADVLVVACEWPDYRDVSMTEVLAGMQRPLVLDANGFLSESLVAMKGVTHVTVGRVVRL